jgi:hypothetical protein
MFVINTGVNTMHSQQSIKVNNAMAQVELPQKVLEQLITSGFLQGSECKCLNRTAKNVLWHSLLECSMLE